MATLAILAIFCSLMRQISLKDMGLADINMTDAKYYISRGITLLKVDLVMVFSLIAGGALACAGAAVGKSALIAGNCLPHCVPAVVPACLPHCAPVCASACLPHYLPAAGVWGAQAFGYGAYNGCLPAVGAWSTLSIFGRCVPCTPFFWF